MVFYLHTLQLINKTSFVYVGVIELRRTLNHYFSENSINLMAKEDILKIKPIRWNKKHIMPHKLFLMIAITL